MGVPLSTFAAASTPPSEIVGCVRAEIVSGCRRDPAAVIVIWGVPGVDPSMMSTHAKPYLLVRHDTVAVDVDGVHSGSPGTLLNVTALLGLTLNETPDPSTATPTASVMPTAQYPKSCPTNQSLLPRITGMLYGVPVPTRNMYGIRRVVP